ncbi:MAG: SDR family oxidoreductase [Elusimicrobia bacterium]|nr:SDR family oxidoreductase [Elusimicrobiota bacterium]
MPIKNPRILILGGGGTLGHKLWQKLPERFSDVHVSLRKPKSRYARCGLFDSANVIDGLDLREPEALEKKLVALKPGVIVNCAGVTLRCAEAKDARSNILVNALLPHRLAAWCEKNGARLIHLSTVCVYDGKKGGYAEADPSDALDLYGRTKSLGDVSSPSALVLRSSFIGREIFGGSELLEWFLAQKGKKIKGFRKAIFTGLSTNRFAETIAALIADFPKLRGLYHVSSEAVSKYDLLLLMKEAYNVPVDIEPEDAFVCRRDLNGTRFEKETGLKAPPWKAMMAEMAADKTPYDQWRTA